MNPVKLYICKEILNASKDAYNNYKQGSISRHNSTYPPAGYGYGQPCHCHCRQGGGRSDPMQFLSSIKNSRQLKSLPQKLASLKHGAGHGGGGVKKILPQVLKGIKQRF